MKTKSLASKNSMIAAFTGTILVALCCFTPLLVLLLGVVGLSILTPYLDIVLLPALIIMAAITILSYVRWRKADLNN